VDPDAVGLLSTRWSTIEIAVRRLTPFSIWGAVRLMKGMKVIWCNGSLMTGHVHAGRQ
jgi:hypothetical protein